VASKRLRFIGSAPVGLVMLFEMAGFATGNDARERTWGVDVQSLGTGCACGHAWVAPSPGPVEPRIGNSAIPPVGFPAQSHRGPPERPQRACHRPVGASPGSLL